MLWTSDFRFDPSMHMTTQTTYYICSNIYTTTCAVSVWPSISSLTDVSRLSVIIFNILLLLLYAEVTCRSDWLQKTAHPQFANDISCQKVYNYHLCITYCIYFNSFWRIMEIFTHKSRFYRHVTSNYEELARAFCKHLVVCVEEKKQKNTQTFPNL